MTIKNEWDLADSENKDEKSLMARCPDCFRPPETIFDAKGTVELVCHGPYHMHIAQGNSLGQAILHWNKYVEFIKIDRQPKASKS